jgi:hypothetical protein
MSRQRKKSYTVLEVGDLFGITKRAVQYGLVTGYFPNHYPCECGHSVMIPAKDVRLEQLRRATIYNGNSKKHPDFIAEKRLNQGNKE